LVWSTTCESSQLEEALPQLVAGQLVDRPQTAVAEVVDVVHLHLLFAFTQPQHVLDGGDEILGPECHLRLGHVEAELAIDPKPPHATQPIAVGVLELLLEERDGLVEGRRIAGPQPLVDADQRILMARGHAGTPPRLVGILTEAVHDQGHLLLLHQLHRLEARGADQFRLIVGDRVAGIDDDLAGPLASLRIDDVVDRDLAFELADTAAAGHLLHRRLVEELENLRVAAVLRIHRPQERERGKLAALVDADLEGVFLGDVDLDPAAALGDDATVVGLPVGRFGVGHEVDPGRTMELADDDPLGTVDDELTAAEHDRHVAEVDLLLDRLLAGQSQPDPQRPAIGQPQLPALVGRISRLAEVVAEIFELDRLVVALDREDLPQHSLDALIFPLVGSDVVLQKRFVEAGLDFGEVGDDVTGAAAAKLTDFGGLESANGASCH
jgi:hypothetical protein